MENKTPYVSKRDFLKLLAAAAGSLALRPVFELGLNDAPLSQGEERQKKEHRRFETVKVVWYPIYETHHSHEKAVSPENISENMDVLSIEGSFLLTDFVEDVVLNGIQTYKKTTQNVFQRPIESLFCRILQGHDTELPSNSVQFPPATLEMLKERHLPVAFGDLDTSTDLFNAPFEMRAALSLRKKIGEKLLGLGAGTSVVGRIARELKIDQPALVKKIGDGLVLAGVTAYLPAKYRTELQREIISEVQKGREPSKLLLRLNTLAHHLTPEVLNDQFREVVQANKLMTLADAVGQKQNRKPNVGFNWHYTHKGIEDWLRIGQTITRKCILAFPDEILREIIKANNDDPRCLFSIRVAKVPQSLQILKLDVSKNIFATSHNPAEVVEDTVVTDVVLQEALHLRGLC